MIATMPNNANIDNDVDDVPDCCCDVLPVLRDSGEMTSSSILDTDDGHW